MKKIILILVFLLTGCSLLDASKPVNQEKEDYFTIMSSLLGINKNRFTYTDQNGAEQPDQLKLYKELEKVYVRNRENSVDGKYSHKQLKVLMLFAFYAESRNSGAFSENLASDLMPIYLNNKTAFLASLHELPFLIPPVCDRMNAFFGFEGKNASQKEGFIKENFPAFKAQLTVEQAEICFAQFER